MDTLVKAYLLTVAMVWGATSIGVILDVADPKTLMDRRTAECLVRMPIVGRLALLFIGAVFALIWPLTSLWVLVTTRPWEDSR